MAEKGSEAWWRDYLTKGHRLEGVARTVFPLLPKNPRCKVCSAPFAGIGKIMRPFGWSPSLKNPNICGFCSQRLPAGGAEVDVSIFVADVRGYTAMSEKVPPLELAATMTKFFSVVTKTLIAYDALIDKYMGDGLQAIFIAGIAGPEFALQSVRAAKAVFEALANADEDVRSLPVGAAVHSGTCFVGNVGPTGMVDLTAMGDVVNTANRLQSEAAAGEILLGPELYSICQSETRTLPSRSLRLKGKDDEIEARVWMPIA